MSGTASSDHVARLLAIYDDAIDDVYGYLLARCRNATVAEDLTAETFMGAVDSIRRGAVVDVTVAWLVGITRHKLVDHWRRVERDERRMAAVKDDPTASTETVGDGVDEHLDVLLARDVLARLGAHHRAALSLRYLDGLPVARVANVLERTEQATETLLIRAKRAFRQQYRLATGGTEVTP